ncbi:TRIM71 [Mytilus edulis]|uniref:TRIM71 n=1 Tax=Mytilus edulis TaxID=6550 RepID=A0A8S3PZN2_MYTED|nr:TRIM71 [Mytilus edulis]
MASSIRKAQSPLSCQLCDNPNVIKWKCVDCKLLMCDNCKERIHPRFKLSEKHSILSIKDVGKKEIDISAQFGSLQISQPVISSLLSTYTSNFTSFGKIQYSGNDTLYCSSHSKEFGYKFFIIRLLKESIKVLQELDIECTDFALGIKNEIFYGQFHGSELKVLSTDGVTNTVLSTSPMLILCTHINKDNEITLGLREQGSPFPVTEFRTRLIVVFDVNNKRKLSIECDQNGEKLFSYVWRISTDSYNNIYAIDQFENYDGRIVALERSGGVKFFYKGHDSVNTPETPFNPIGIVITETNIIIVCDERNDSLHALNTKGELIGLQTLTDLGVIYPCSLCLDSEGFLLIGCNSRVNEAIDAKIHVTKISL